MKTIAIISSQAFSLVNFRGNFIVDLVTLNYNVYALAPDYTNELKQQIASLGAVPVDFRLDRTGIRPARDLLDAARLVFLLRRLKPDITLTYFIKPVIFGTVAAWLAGVPRRIAMIEGLGYVFTLTGNELSSERKILRYIISILYRGALSHANDVIFLNPDDIAYFVTRNLVKSEKVHQLDGIGVDLDIWLPKPVVSSPVTFLLAGRLLREKGIVEYAQAAAIVKRLVPSVRCILLGALDANPGSLEPKQLEQLIEAGGLEWPGHVDVKPWLAQASVYVLPSYREGLPRSTQEAMAMGRAVITTDVPGCRETVVDGVNGFLVPVRDSESLAEAMLKFARNKELIETMGRQSRRIALERFDVKLINPKLLHIVDPTFVARGVS